MHENGNQAVLNGKQIYGVGDYVPRGAIGKKNDQYFDKDNSDFFPLLGVMVYFHIYRPTPWINTLTRTDPNNLSQ